MNLGDTKKIAVVYNQLGHDPRQGKYIPNPQWDHYTQSLFHPLLDSLPDDSDQMSLVDLGAGAGKWSALLHDRFKDVIAIEPNDLLSSRSTMLIKKLGIKNVCQVNDHMPRCLDSIQPAAVLMAESLYLAADWQEVVDILLDKRSLKWMAIADGPDSTLNRSTWDTPYVSGSRRPLLMGDERMLIDKAETAGFDARLIDVMPDRWLLIMEKKHAHR